MQLEERTKKLKQILHRNGSKLLSFTFVLELFSQEEGISTLGSLRDMRDAAALLSQVFYWQDKMSKSKKRSKKTLGWAFYKSDASFEVEMFMSRRTFDRSRNILKVAGYLETKIFQINNISVNHYRITDKLYQDILALEKKQIEEANEIARKEREHTQASNANACSQVSNDDSPHVNNDMPCSNVDSASYNQRLLAENTSNITRSDTDIPF